jgi:hypothetical protein
VGRRRRRAPGTPASTFWRLSTLDVGYRQTYLVSFSATSCTRVNSKAMYDLTGKSRLDVRYHSGKLSMRDKAGSMRRIGDTFELEKFHKNICESQVLTILLFAFLVSNTAGLTASTPRGGPNRLQVMKIMSIPPPSTYEFTKGVPFGHVRLVLVCDPLFYLEIPLKRHVFFVFETS